MMKMNEKKKKKNNPRTEDQGISSVRDPTSVLLQAEHTAWNEANLAGSAWEGFF